MSALIKKHQRRLLVVLILICMGIITAGGVHYIETLRTKLQGQAVMNVLTVTVQQRQAVDSFISGDRERLHSYANFFSRSMDHEDPQKIQQQLTMFQQVDEICSVKCPDEGWFCSNASEEIRQVDERSLAPYRAFSGSGVRDAYIGLYSGNPKFGYYETFTFPNGHTGIVQMSYDRSKVSEAFSLSFYNGQGFSYILDSNGDILLRSVRMSSDRSFDNVFDALTETGSRQEDIDAFASSMDARETGSLIFDGDNGEFIYTYVPMESVEGWYLLSIIPVEAIAEETDQILQSSQMAMGFLIVILFACAVFVLLIWRTHKYIEAKEHEVQYQTQLFDIFATYLSRNTDDVYMLLDAASGEVEYVSPNLERVLGISQQKVAEDLLSFETTNPSGERVNLETLKNLHPGDGLATVTTNWFNPRTGEHRWFLESAYGAQVQGKRKVVLYVSDRTEERNAQESLSEALRMAQAANEAKSAFLGNVSHDIRTPMNAIIGFLALMRDEADNPDMVREYTQRIDAASQHLLGLINDVLDMNKIESGSATLTLSEMNLAEVVDEINTIIRPQTRAKDQTFDIFVSHLNYEHLLGDKLRINQILINLMSNSVKYTPKGGTIQLRVEELPQVVDNYSRIRFTVSDNGLGMSEEYQKVIFDPFTREETKITHEIQGTGLGMAITKSLVDLMGGSIHVKSELGKGSTFTVELELCIQEQEDDPRFWTDHRVARMIVADDEEEVCQNIVKAMSKVGVEADYATDGETAIEKMRSAREAGRPYNLVLLDWKMPGLSGLETARLIRKNFSEKIPILLLTAYDWSEIEEEAMEIGVDHFMPKPFFMTTFKEAIRRVMGGTKKAEAGQTDVVRGKRIMVVDDIEVNRMILMKILGAQGAVCDTAGNGQEAVEKFEASQPGEYDLILMDVQMPVMDGYTATRTIRAGAHPSAKDVPIIAMTANAFVDDVRDAIESGMDAHIAKPVQINNLITTIQQVLDSRGKQGGEHA